jgi:hypothetical protein
LAIGLWLATIGPTPEPVRIADDELHGSYHLGRIALSARRQVGQIEWFGCACSATLQPDRGGLAGLTTDAEISLSLKRAAANDILGQFSAAFSTAKKDRPMFSRPGEVDGPLFSIGINRSLW